MATRRARVALFLASVAIGAMVVLVGFVTLGMAPWRGPLTDPGSLDPNAGFTGAGGWVHSGQPFRYSLADVLNASRVNAIVDSVDVASPTPGLQLLATFMVDRRPGCISLLTHIFQPGVPPQSSCLQPASGWTVPAHTGPSEAQRMLLVFRIAGPGTYSFRGVNVHYHVGPLHFTSTYMIGMTVCAPRADTVSLPRVALPAGYPADGIACVR